MRENDFLFRVSSCPLCPLVEVMSSLFQASTLWLTHMSWCRYHFLDTEITLISISPPFTSSSLTLPGCFAPPQCWFYGSRSGFISDQIRDRFLTKMHANTRMLRERIRKTGCRSLWQPVNQTERAFLSLSHYCWLKWDPPWNPIPVPFHQVSCPLIFTWLAFCWVCVCVWEIQWVNNRR